MQTLWQDLRYGARMLLKRRSFTLIAVLTLALGIGANTAIFSVVNGVLLRPLPYRQPERIVRLFETVNRSAMASDRMEVAPANFLDWQAQAKSFSGIAAYGFGNLPLSGAGEAEVVPSAWGSHNLFATLDVKPFIGRTFTPDEDGLQKKFVAVLGYGLWQRRFGGDEKVIGQRIGLDGRDYTIIGVMPAGFQFPREAQIWTPLALNERQVTMREARFLKVVARIKPDASLEQARAGLNTIAANLAQQFPQTNQNWGVKVVPLLDEEVGKVRPALLVLFGVVGLVLLIACANVANLSLARATARRTELAVRLALGANRSRLMRQLLTESLILSLLGGGLGFLLALWGVDALTALAPPQLPRVGEARLDQRVLGFTFAISILTGIIFGWLPALQATRLDVNSALKESGGRASGGAPRNRALGALVVVETALALVVLAGAGLLANSFLRLRGVDSGLQAENVLTVRFTPPAARYNDREKWKENRLSFFNQLFPRLKALPGVEAVAAVDSLPLSGGGRVYRFRKEGDTADTSANPAATFQVATSDYFRAVGLQLRRGRLFDETDREDSPPVVVINAVMARRFWPGEEALGKRIFIRNQEYAREIIGVVNDVKHFGLDREAPPEMYIPFNQLVIDLMPLVIRTKSDPAGIINAVHEQVRAVDPTVAIAKMQTMPQIAAASLAERRFTALLLGLFGGVALLLAGVGIYGVMSTVVTQRAHEIGVRMALGARAADVLKLVVREGMMLAVVGVAIGLGAALLVTRLMASLLYGVSATDPATFALIALLLTAVALLACYIPARRAAKVDPMIALRCE